MNKRLKKFTLIVAAIALVGTMAGCSKGGKAKSDTDEKKNGAKYPKYQDQMKVDSSFKGKTLTVWGWWDLDDVAKKQVQEFQNLTGATLSYSNIPWADYPNKAITAITAGNGPDIVYFDAQAIPTWVVKNIIIPISDHVDLKKQPAFQKLSKNAVNFYTWKDKVYGLVNGGPNSYKLFYRKDIFKNNGLEDPYDLFKQGQWTWDKFFDLGQKLTQDTNGDGKMDVYGYDSWAVDQWLFSNGANYVTTKDGKPTFVLDDPKAITALQAMRDIDTKYKMKSPYDPNKDPQAKFTAGITAMDYWGSWQISDFRKALGDKLGIVPFPLGPDYKGKAKTADMGGSTAEGISASCKNIDLAVFWNELCRLPENEQKAKEQETKDKQDNLTNYGSDEMYKLNIEMDNNSQINPVNGYGDLSKIVDTILNKSGDKSPAQAVEANKQAAQAQIDATMAAAK